MAKWSDLYDADLLNDIVVGLVLHLDPERLADEGATCTDPPGVRVEGQHFFICISVDGQNSRWVPLFTDPNTGRVALSKDDRVGHPKWIRGTFHYHSAQIWSATAQAVANAAARAHDKSRRGTRNLIAPQHVPNL